MPTKVLILTADAGFGHRSAANAIEAALKERYGEECVVTQSNPMQDPRTPVLLRRSQSDYDKLVQTNPDLYRIGYETSDASLPVGLAESALIVMLYAALRDVVQTCEPDVVITTYPLYQAPLAAVFALRRHYVPLLTVVTDLVSVHALWFSDEVDMCLVPTTAVEERAHQLGLPAERIVVTGLPVNPRLAQPVDRATLRARLGWDPEQVTALFVGSKRVRQFLPVANVLNHSGLPLQLALVAGGSETLSTEWKNTEWHRPAFVYDYVKDMADMLLATDFVVCKAGGLIVSEAMAAGRPMLLVEAIPGQETGNAEYVVQGEAGEMALSPVEALVAVCHWLEHDAALLARRAAAARQLGRPEAAYRVAELAWEAAARGPVHREHRLLDQVSQLRELLSTPPLADGR